MIFVESSLISFSLVDGGKTTRQKQLKSKATHFVETRTTKMLEL